MIFNLWRKYPKRKPEHNGYYLCTVIEANGEHTLYKLYYKKTVDKWIDMSRQTVFDGYVVYKVCRAPIEENRVYTDGMCNRTEDVIAWKQLSKEYRRRKRK